MENFETKIPESVKENVKPVLRKKISVPEDVIKVLNQIVQDKVRRYTPYLLLGLVAIVATFAVYYRYEAYALKKNPQKAAQQETQKLLANIAQLIVLPEGETPTVATVTDPERLKEQPFFAKAKKGDKVLIYTNARKAILYDGQNNKIVEVAPINIGNPSSQKADSE